MTKRYSKVYLNEGDKYSGIRYNYTDSVLEYVSKYDCEIIDDELVNIIKKEWEVIDSIGLSKENWKDDSKYWVDQYKMELDEEMAFLIQYI